MTEQERWLQGEIVGLNLVKGREGPCVPVFDITIRVSAVSRRISELNLLHQCVLEYGVMEDG